MDFEKRLREDITFAEETIKKYLPAEEGFQKTLLSAMNYSILAGGKRLRPVLMLECYRMFGGNGEIIEPFMAAQEMIHTYSLVHDDLPAMDNDLYRRGKKTTHAVYGEAMAVLAGDGLLNLAFETACTAFLLEGERRSEKKIFAEEERKDAEAFSMGAERRSGQAFSGGEAERSGERFSAGEEKENGKSADGICPDGGAERAARAMTVLAGKAGIYGMIGGQAVDVEAEKQNLRLNEEKLLFIHAHKTAALIQSSMMIGAILAGAGKEDVRRLEKAGYNIGIAFQIQDDILDVTSTLEELGKPIGSDEKNGKLTYVSAYGLKKAKADVEKLSEEALEILQSMPERNEFLEELVISLITRRK